MYSCAFTAFAPSREDVLSSLAFFFGDPAVPESTYPATSQCLFQSVASRLTMCPSRCSQNCVIIPSTTRCKRQSMQHTASIFHLKSKLTCFLALRRTYHFREWHLNSSCSLSRPCDQRFTHLSILCLLDAKQPTPTTGRTPASATRSRTSCSSLPRSGRRPSVSIHHEHEYELDVGVDVADRLDVVLLLAALPFVQITGTTVCDPAIELGTLPNPFCSTLTSIALLHSLYAGRVGRAAL